MPDEALLLDFECPRCEKHQARLTVRSLSVATLTCSVCGHVWAVDVVGVPAKRLGRLSGQEPTH